MYNPLCVRVCALLIIYICPFASQVNNIKKKKKKKRKGENKIRGSRALYTDHVEMLRLGWGGNGR